MLTSCASDALPVEEMEEVAEPSAQAATAPIPTGDTPYDAPGAHEVLQVDNVGVGFETKATDDSALCKSLVPLLSNGKASKEQLDAFSKWPEGMNRKLYTLFRPAVLEEGKKYPVVTWGNGTCATPVGYDDLLKQIASHGFLVIGANNRQVGNGEAMLTALDYLKSENDKPSSPLYGKVDLTKVGAAGHSQGGGATVRVSSNPRIHTAVPIEGAGATTHRKPIFFIAGDKDTVVSASSVATAYRNTVGPVVYGLGKNVDHVTPIAEAPRIWGAVTAWFRAHLADDAEARALFYGDCGLCKETKLWTIQRKGLQ